MPRPLQRTALREADRRVTSPSSQSTVVAVIGPTPYWRIRAWQPIWRRAKRASFALEDDQLAVELVDDRQGDLDSLQGRRRQHECAQERASVRAQQLVGDVDDAV